MTELITPTITDRKIAKELGAKFNSVTNLWTLPKNKEALFNDFIKVYLTVSFDDKDEVKELGAKWDKDHKKWYISKKQSATFKNGLM
jgi:DNA topoisomerase-3